MNVDNTIKNADKLANTFLKFDSNHIIRIILILILIFGSVMFFVIYRDQKEILKTSLDNNTKALNKLSYICGTYEQHNKMTENIDKNVTDVKTDLMILKERLR